MKKITADDLDKEMDRLLAIQELNSSKWTKQEDEVFRKARSKGLSVSVIHSNWEKWTGRKRTLDAFASKLRRTAGKGS